MKKIYYLLLLTSQFAFSQVDVVYSNLVWSDEFSTNGAVNGTNWHHQTQIPAGGSWYNNEVQHYTNRTANSFVSGGMLNVVAKKEAFTDQGYTKQYTSVRLNSKFAFKYGRVDIRAKVPTNQGTWPALWLLGKNINEDGAFFDATHGNTSWPACGEIDIMEHGITPSQPAGYVQSAMHTPSSSGNTVNIGGTIANNLGTAFHVYSMNWSPFQITFLLDGVAYYTYNPAVKTASNWPFAAEQYLLLNIAMGGVAGTIPSSFTQATMEVDYVRVYQNTVVDSQIPTNFTASVGAITNNSVELLMNATDNSGNIAYTVTYGATTVTEAGTSGVQKSIIISGLTANTNYSFSVAAKDLAGNNAANNSIVLNATTLAVAAGNTACAGTDTVAQQGSFSTGYKYGFQTIGTDVKFTFELLDTNRVGVVAYLWKQNPFTEYQMTNVSGLIFTKTLSGFTAGNTINYAVKFAFSGGLAVTKYFSYVVGNNCSLSTSDNDLVDFEVYPNPTSSLINIASNDKIDAVEIYNVVGNLVFKQDNINTIDVSTLSKGMYFLTVIADDKKSTKKIVVE